ncbi:DUF3618 domain-containing protein [Microvirga flavescens]|uniref:DUF3618 domain-containing protein n=1 Tax=Microvirga flavescens TaxID=2249811 RepID=UPI000DD7DE05|nr:DUF3618 domain-containing protein [Microvirga flavescens]
MTQKMDELEEDIERSRIKLDQAIDRLQKRLTVSGVVDDALGIVRAGPYASLYENMLSVIRRNPVPVLLATAGVGLLLQQMRKDAHEDQHHFEGENP